MEVFVGIDVGTSSLKVVAVEVEDQLVRVVAEVNKKYNSEGKPSRNPAQWVEYARQALSSLNIPPPVGIGLTGQMHALVALDSQRRELSPTLLWLDLNGSPELEQFVRGFPDGFVERTGNIPLPDFTLAKWLHARRVNPALTGQTAHLLPAKDYVRWALFPETAPVTDDSEAVGTQLFHPFRRVWDDQIVSLAQIPVGALPSVVDPLTIVGTAASLVPDWKDTVVVVGAGDQATAARAVGADEEGTVSVSMGTSGVVCVPWRRADLPPGWDGALHLIPGTQSGVMDVIATVPAFGPTLEWLSRLFQVDLVSMDRTLAKAKVEPSATSPRFFPYLEGSGAPHPDGTKRAVLSNLSLGVGRDELFRAVYDGLAMEIASLVGEVARWGAPAKEFVFSGGASRLPHFAATVASYLPGACSRSENSSASAIGAALLAHDAVHPGHKPILPRERVGEAARRNLDAEWSQERDGIVTRPKGVQP